MLVLLSGEPQASIRVTREVLCRREQDSLEWKRTKMRQEVLLRIFRPGMGMLVTWSLWLLLYLWNKHIAGRLLVMALPVVS